MEHKWIRHTGVVVESDKPLELHEVLAIERWYLDECVAVTGSGVMGNVNWFVRPIEHQDRYEAPPGKVRRRRRSVGSLTV